MASSGSSQTGNDASSWRQPTTSFEEECLDILYFMDMELSTSTRFFFVRPGSHGQAVAGCHPTYDRALFARVASQDRYAPSIRLHLGLPGLYDTLKRLASLGSGHSLESYG